MQLYENDDNLVQATSAIHSAGISTLQLRFWYRPYFHKFITLLDRRIYLESG